MSESENAIHRERNPQIDFINLQLLMVVNQLKAEILAQKARHGSIIDKLLNADSIKDMNKNVHFDVVSIRDRVDLLLKIAKNLLRSPDDPDNTEYHNFENLVSAILNYRLLKVKKMGLQKKIL
jgi:hypothetical protein